MPSLWKRIIIGILVGAWGMLALYLGIDAIVTKKTHLSFTSGGVGLGGSGVNRGWDAVGAGIGHIVASAVPLSVAFSVIFLPSIYCRLGIWKDDQHSA